MASLLEDFKKFISTLNPGLAEAFKGGKVTNPLNKATKRLDKARKAIEASKKRRREANK